MVRDAVGKEATSHAAYDDALNQEGDVVIRVGTVGTLLLLRSHETEVHRLSIDFGDQDVMSRRPFQPGARSVSDASFRFRRWRVGFVAMLWTTGCDAKVFVLRDDFVELFG